MPLENYVVEINVENTTDTIIYVTTEDFKIKNIQTNEYLSKKDNQIYFPPNEFGYYIDFVRLRPKISDTLLGEKIEIICGLSISNAKDEGSFNVVSTCSYAMTIDKVRMEDELNKKIQSWKDHGMKKEDIDFESRNWRLLDGKRIITENSFDFIIETIGIYTNKEILTKACYIIIEKLKNIETLNDTDELKINDSINILNNSYDIILDNEDYTIGKIIEYMFYSKYFETKMLNFCGFKKLHPHDSYSIIRIAYKDFVEKSIIKQNLKECIIDAISVYQKILKKI
jgi:DNA-directed RNA polymerase subunit L